MTTVFEALGGLDAVQGKGDCTLINFTLVEEITAFREPLLGGLLSVSADTLYEPLEVH